MKDFEPLPCGERLWVCSSWATTAGPGGDRLCLSGIVEEQVEPVMTAYPAVDFAEPTLSGNWVRLTGTQLV